MFPTLPVLLTGKQELCLSPLHVGNVLGGSCPWTWPWGGGGYPQEAEGTCMLPASWDPLLYGLRVYKALCPHFPSRLLTHKRELLSPSVLPNDDHCLSCPRKRLPGATTLISDLFLYPSSPTPPKQSIQRWGTTEQTLSKEAMVSGVGHPGPFLKLCFLLKLSDFA